MKNLIKISLFSLFAFIYVGTAMATDSADNKISITVVVEAKSTKHLRIYATGFSVNKKGRGALGRSTTKSGPKNAKYSFGFRGIGHDYDCGSAVLKRNSIVLLYMKNHKCMNRVFAKK